MSCPSTALIARDLVKVYRDRRVLDGVSLTAVPGRRIGLIGENGAGKSTLLRLLAGVEEPDAGTVTRPDGLGFGHQELPFAGDRTVAAVLDDALRETRDAVRELDRLATALAARPDDPDLLAAYGERLEWAQGHDAWDADRRAELVLAGLGLAGVARTRRLETLSGGQRSRLALAAQLLRRPAALLLDEPTNHLDDDAAGFLERELRRLPGVVVVASHDRAFLDAVCTDVVDLDPALDGPTRYGGTYTDYLAARRAARARWQQRYAREQDELAALRHAVAITSRRVAPGRGPRDNDKMGYDFLGGRVQSQVSRRVRNAAQRLDSLTREQVRRPPEPLRFRAPVPAGAADGDGPAVALTGVRVPARLALDRLDVAAADRLLVTGANGAGKSTLLAVLAGELTPAAGEVRRRRGLRAGLLAQDVVFHRPGRTAQDVYATHLGAERAERIPLASLGLLAPRDTGRPVGELSVGQRRRLALALLVADAPHLLLLDEPTNHLSPVLAEELEEALRTSAGAIVVASHDRWLRHRWPGRELRLHNGHPA
ncbi:ABC-F family ATP-binding cassette domain-containing protein [Pseudonocardia bannensis]|uniref:ABC-F family ATP-binding cassette domain-containing protein n=1 Tax=Pseudonocardia bannensis TaxID=630973 RepID=A0A848DJB4_9PSEU|nr:ABC-F family ATP-binding cassette domain-containing protein [Pseudonocardia bannensis]